ncbi:MAG: serine hydrolase domain-containing protein, partial [Planctomycetota bacterium]
KRILNTAETVFPLESVTKQFTAAAIMTLEMQGKLQTSDPLSRFFDNVPADKSDVTLHHLLSHTSGIITGTDTYYADTSRSAIVAVALENPLLFTPGSRDAYSNIGYALLAAVVETVSGMSFEAYLRDALFAPADMAWTGSRLPSWHERTLAHRYARGTDNGTSLDMPYPDWNHMGAGDLLTTTDDLYRWHQALLGDAILSEAAKTKMYTPVANGYGYGWFISEGDHGPLVEHDGGSSRGTAADFRRYLDEDLVIIVFTNNDGEYMLFSARLRDNIRDLVFGATRPLPPEVPEQRGVSTAEFLGTYELEDGGTLDIQAAGKLLEVSGVGQSSVTALLSLSKDEAEGYASVSRRASNLLQGLRDENLQPLHEASAGRMGERLEAMFAGLVRSSGEITGYSVLGTVPPTGVGAATHMTLFRVDFGGSPQFFRFYWSDAGIIALGGGRMRQPIKLRAAPLDDEKFVGYHIVTGRSVTLEFRRDDQDRITAVTAGRQQLRATRRSSANQ